MENSITGVGLAAPSTLTNAESVPGVENAGDVRSRIANGIETRGDQRIEQVEERSVRMQERYAELGEKAEAAGYEHLASGMAHRADATESRQTKFAERIDLTTEKIATLIESGPEMRSSAAERVEAAAQGGVARAEELGGTLVEFWEGAAERTREAGNEAAAARFEENAVNAQQIVDTQIGNINTRSEELIATLQSPPSAEGLVDAVEWYAEQSTADLAAFNANVQAGFAAANEQAMEAGYEQFADRLNNRAERFDGRINARADNIVERTAEFIDRIESNEIQLPEEGVDLLA